MVREGRWKRDNHFSAEESKLAASAVENFEPNYRDLVESAADIIYALDLEGRFTLYNSKAWEFLGHQPGEYVGRHFTELLTPESARVAVQHFQEGVQGVETTPFFEVEVIKRDGSIANLEIRASNIIRNGQLVGRQGIGRDISELKRLQAEVAQNAERIALLEERNRIARELYGSIVQIVFRTSADPRRTEALLSEMRSSLVAEAAKSLALSEVDLAIIELISRGLSNEEIGQQVCLSAHTVKDHVRKIMDRLDVRRRTELVAEAIRRGLV
jgi:PAS domain S-box-containing protein